MRQGEGSKRSRSTTTCQVGHNHNKSNTRHEHHVPSRPCNFPLDATQHLKQHCSILQEVHTSLGNLLVCNGSMAAFYMHLVAPQDAPHKVQDCPLTLLPPSGSIALMLASVRCEESTRACRSCTFLLCAFICMWCIAAVRLAGACLGCTSAQEQLRCTLTG